MVKDLRQDRSRNRRRANRLSTAGLEVQELLSSDEEYSDSSVTIVPPPSKAATTKTASKPPTPVKTITDRTRIQCMKKLYDEDSTPGTKKHCRRLFEGIVAKNLVVTTAINDLGSMGVMSQDIVERTKMFLPATPLNTEE
jgi:hypothetical protein